MHYVVTGANRGIGLEFVRQLVARGEEVTATAREPEKATELQELARVNPGRVHVERLDVRDDASVERFAGVVKSPVDVLINNAGKGAKKLPLEQFPIEDLLVDFDTNAVGTLRVTRALLPKLRAGKGKKILHLSSLRGSITENEGGSSYGYRMSKVALNMAARSLAVDLRPEGILSLPVHPGWVQTDMGGPDAPTLPKESVAGLLSLLDRSTLEHSGRFFDFTGKELPW